MKHTVLRRAGALMLSLALSWTVLHGMPVSAENQTADWFKESTETILNPGMGYTSTIWYRCAPGNTPVQNPTGSLVLMFIDIGKFSSGVNGTTDDEGNYTPGRDYPLDDAFFDGLRGTFENCRKNGCTMALRFRYDDDGTRDPEPATFDMLKSHIAQIAESKLLEEYQDILMFVESGFVGCYGEQWGGKYCSLEQKAELLDLLLDVVPDPIPVTVRTPNIFATWAGIPVTELADWQSEPGSRAARVGMFDDGYMGSDSDLGTYSNRSAETAWLGRQSVTSYFGGEFSGNLEFAQKYDTYLPENAIPEMYRTHLSYINSNIFGLYQNYTFGKAYDVPDVDNSAYYGLDVRKFIRDHLGYRFVLRSLELPQRVSQGGELALRFSVENTGFANPIRQQKAELILERGGNYIRTDIPVDSRKWLSCTETEEEIAAALPGGLEPGEWNVYLKLSVGNNTVPQTGMRSVRFANPDIWSIVLGANYLGTVNITPAETVSALTRTSFGSGDGTLYTVNQLQLTDGAVSFPNELGEPAAVSETGRLYLHSDEQYLYITAVYDAKADAEVHNFSLTNSANGTRYWIYYQSNGFIYFNQGTPTGCLQRHSDGIVEFRVPFGEVMGLETGVTLTGIRYFQQDSAHEWAVCSDVTAESYTLDGTFPVYQACRSVSLAEGASITLTVADGAAAPAKYQWYHDGKAIAGADQPALPIADADASAKGLYAVKITSAKGAEVTADICRVTDVCAAGLPGDVNADGQVSAADAVSLLRWLLVQNQTLPAWKNADLNADGRLTSADFARLKQMLLS